MILYTGRKTGTPDEPLGTIHQCGKCPDCGDDVFQTVQTHYGYGSHEYLAWSNPTHAHGNCIRALRARIDGLLAQSRDEAGGVHGRPS